MIGRLKKLFADPAAGWPRAVQDPVLGELHLSEDGSWWEGRAMLGDRPILLMIGGEGQPDSALLEHARRITADLAGFDERVARFLARELEQERHLRPYAEEIRQLRIDELGFLWPERPNAVMVCFAGPDPYRLWRCEYADGSFYGFAFDD